MTASTLAYLAEAERRGAHGTASAPYLCNCDICRPHPTTPEEHEMTDTHEPLIAGSPRSLAEVVECIKQTGGAVEIQGVRIEPCDDRGETATTRNLSEVMELLGQMEGKYVQAREWAAWFAAERDQTRDYLNQAAEFLQETSDEHEALLTKVADREVVQAEPHAYIAVKRYYSAHAGGPKWNTDAEVIPAADLRNDIREWHREHGYDLLPIVGTETGTRPAAPQSDPAGYVVVTRNSEGGLHRSATAWDDLERATAAGDFQARHAEGTGCTAAVYELREVHGA